VLIPPYRPARGAPRAPAVFIARTGHAGRPSLCPHPPLDTNDTSERYAQLIRDLCATVGLADAEHVLRTRSIEVEGFDLRLEYFENDLEAMYANFHYGTVTAGRTLVVFRLMLEANLLIYAQDQAQLGLDTDTGGIVLVLRVPMTYDVDGNTLADLLAHYAEHGRYWRQSIIESTDEMFEGIVAGEFVWLRA
jgi:hypothetical protein